MTQLGVSQANQENTSFLEQDAISVDNSQLTIDNYEEVREVSHASLLPMFIYIEKDEAEFGDVSRQLEASPIAQLVRAPH